MARKKSGYKRMKKIEPAVQTLQFTQIQTEAGAASTSYIDLSQCASLVNRRFYRQGINWAVSGFKVLSNGVPVGITINKLPSTWVMSNSWEKGFRVWQRMNNEALAETESIRPRFLDFKIYANAQHHQTGYGANLLPVSGFGSQAASGEWEASTVIIPRTDSTTGIPAPRELLAVGANYPGASASSGLNAVSLIEGYASSRALPDVLDPNTPDDASDTSGVAPQNWMSALFNDGIEQTEEVLATMTGPLAQNNIAPYPFENDGVNLDTMYPNGANQMSGLETHDIEYVTTTTISGTSRLKGGMFPCGLIEFSVVNQSLTEGSQLTLLVDLVRGNHRGYLCEPMTDM
jgi:hypothetical protein